MGVNMKSIVAAFVLVFIAVSSACGDVYRWTDDKGVVNFTDDADRIPAKYRKKARRMVTEPVTTIPAESPAPSSTPAVDAPPSSAGQELYGGYGEEWWRGRFRAAREQLQALQNGMVDKRQKLQQISRQRTIYQRSRDRVAYYDLKTEIEQDEKREVELQNKLQDLDQQASTAGVPFDWRK
jgi:hypothetical protein